MADSAKPALLADRNLRAELVRFVRTKVAEADAEDIVQATLTDAVAAESSPADPQELRRWLYGIARHKIADHFRSARRDGVRDSVSGVEAAADSAPLSARELLEWAERELPAGDRAEGTLEWMLREGDGEKLEHIAGERDLDAARVRQRVSRLRRYFRERWAAQLAAVAAVVVMVVAVWWLWHQRKPEEPIVQVSPSAEPSPIERGRQLRRAALEQCAQSSWEPCVRGLDDAARLDPAGDRDDDVQQARRKARDAMSPSAPSQSAAPAPDVTAPVVPSGLPPTPTATTPSVPPPAPKTDSSSMLDWSSPSKVAPPHRAREISK